MTPEQAKELLATYLKGQASPEERHLVESYYRKTIDEIRKEPALEDMDRLNKKEQLAWQRIQRKLVRKKLPNRHLTIGRSLTIAAAILIFVGINYLTHALLTVEDTYEKKPRGENQDLVIDVEPGGNKAVIQLADGSSYALSDNKSILRTDLEGAELVLKSDGGVLYTEAIPSTSGLHDFENQFQQIKTAKGGQFQVVLADGTKVWLNSASSLRYPVRFSAVSRTVHLEGEAYFEVAKNSSAPFIVKSKKQSIEVLGTDFNVNTYDDEAVSHTTLLTGKIRVTDERSKEEKLVNPGEQAIIGEGGLKIKEVNVSNAIAWKSGIFDFSEGNNMASILRQLARWYDLEVEYRGDFPKKEWKGKISKKVKASNIIKLLNYAGINCKLEKTDDGIKLVIL